MPEDKKTDMVIKTKDENDKDINILVKKPTAKNISDAQRYSTMTWTEAIQSGILTRKELDNVLEERGLWSKGKQEQYEKLTHGINERELKLAKGGIKLSRAKKLALEIRDMRIDLRVLISERTVMDANTAEGMADNARFDYFVSCCTFTEDDDRFFKDVDDYKERSSEQAAADAATKLADVIYDLDENFEVKLPENQFLMEHKLVDDTLRFINDKGEYVDSDGRLVNDEGRYINKDGDLVDMEGHLINSEGDCVVPDRKPFLDEDGNPISNDSEDSPEEKPKKKKKASKGKKKVEAEVEESAT